MEKKIWLVGIGGSNADGVVMQRISGTEAEIKELLINMVKEDKFTDPDNWDYGITSVDNVQQDGDSLYAYAVYTDYHIDYMAVPEMPVIDAGAVSFTYLEEPECTLPASVLISKCDVDDSWDNISDLLSDEFGFCVSSYNVKAADDGMSLEVTDIVWDTTD